MAKEFKVLYSSKPKEQWEVHYDNKRVGYQAWDQRVAISYAKDMAKKNRPSTIFSYRSLTMKFSRRLLISSVLSLFVIFPITAFLCGKERWPVKVGTDAQVNVLFQSNNLSSGQLKPAQSTTIRNLRSFAYPYGNITAFTPPADDNIRTSAERVTWTIDATIFAYKQEHPGDDDYHLAIKDENGLTMIAEIPDPGCLSDTPEPMKSMITQARADFDSHFSGAKKVSGSFKTTNTKVRITGPGLFDRSHGQKGYATLNGIEIHPVLKIEFLQYLR